MYFTRDNGKTDKDAVTSNNKKMVENQAELPCQDTRKILAFMGALPCLLSPPYLPSLNLTKSSFVYSVVVYTFMSYDVAVSIRSAKRRYDQIDPSNFLQKTQHFEHVLAMLPHILGIHFWLDVPALMFTLESFKDLQVKFRIATGKPLQNRRKRKERLVLAAAVGCFLFLFLYMITSVSVSFSLDFTAAIACVYGNILAICATFLWTGLSWGIYDAAEDTKAEFNRQLDSLTPSKVYDFRLVWLSMRSALDSMGKLQSTSLLYSLSMTAVVVLFYEAAVLVQNGEIWPATCHLISGAFYVGLVGLICYSSHWVQHEMKCLVGEVLPKIALTSYDIRIQREIVMLFLIESARPAVTNFRGFILVNKNLILSFFSNISTYIIVLVQFSQKGDGFGM